jgi:predicted nuclease of predicted toxin-antitoxin system
MKLLADENFPKTSYRLLADLGYDIIHIGNTHPSIDDVDVMRMAIESDRLILTFDSDFGTLIYKFGFRPIGLIYFRYDFETPHLLAKNVDNYLQSTEIELIGVITVIEKESIRQRIIPK